MIINKEKLLELLVEKSGLPREEVKDQLDELVQNIREAAERGKDFQIDVFGTFSVNKDGSLTFTPSEKLETEINHRYAGMKPIEIIGAFEKTPGVDVEESEDTVDEKVETGKAGEEDFTTSFVYDEPEDEDASEQEEETVFEMPGQKISAESSEAGSEEDVEKTAEAEASEEAGDKDKSLTERKKEKQKEIEKSDNRERDDPFGLKDALESGKQPEPPSSETEEEEPFIPPPGPKKEPVGHKEMEEKEQSESRESRQRPAPSMTPLKVSTASKKSIGKRDTATSKGAARKKQSKSSESDPIGRFLIAAVIVIAIGVSGWLTYDLFLTGNGNGSQITGTSAPAQAELSGTAGSATEQAEPTGAGTGDADMEGTGEEGSTAKDAENTEQEGSQAIEDNEPGSVSNIAEQSRQSIYRLRGGAVPQADQGYTIVVHSLRNEAKARSLGQQLETEGYITVISRATVNGSVFWRVGLGQFRSMEDAQEAVEQLPERFRNNHFIRSIQ